ncbi:hypothetical protein OTK49_21580 [Vibrio coralliirubri]|uniref:hypothetical protein n=1 Tax=Vibrio coralliirubri TaxID=1516159 RepID=UPI00228461BC|nr:hypothetical protein [Vibrio coralliirubri]MCY9865114.1 hypothetical protein [Vibrio coralliirubri]
MITKEQAECTTQYSKSGSHFIAVVTQLLTGSNASTTITLQDDEDYDYVSSTYPELLNEARIEELVDTAFIQADKINKPASKFGEPVPEINENQSNIITFSSESLSMLDWNGKKVEVLNVIANPDDSTHIDAECMPMFHIRLIGTNSTNTAEVDELRGYEDPRMNATLKGLHGALPEDDYSDELKQFYSWGQALVEYKA